MGKLLGQCGRYLWFLDEKRRDWIFDDDFESFNAQHSLGRIYHCVEDNGDFIVIQSKRDESYRVKKEGFRVSPFTNFYIKDRVKILNGSKVGKTAFILGMGWHSNHEKIIFILEIDGKKSSRWYFEEDIEPYE